ncbi:MAG: methyltransferase domain-containing protein [Ruminococcaceae bacterium]|nr:methyltransferase domain-containing protein [Oscillospiraceae bacterium]
MNQTVLEALCCPICKAGLMADGKSCRCVGARSHCFDFAKSGYLNLAGTHAGEGDGKAAVLARRTFLDAGYYQMLSNRMESLLAESTAKFVVDAGSGEGYYTNRIAMERDVLGVDLSRDGVDYAARRAKQISSRAGFVVASLFDLPVRDEAADAVVNLFAPCAEAEFTRVLKPGGILILVGAGEQHLMGLKKVIYDNPYTNPGRSDLPVRLPLIARERLRDEITVVGQGGIDALFSMTPYYWRTSAQDKQKLQSIDTLTTEVDFDIFIYRKEA